ncbi:TPA: AAA family ATPase, partial [Klebsiella pneumoniae]|nr:AAA family ATPase [Klebsiella pneumoniae]
SGTIEISKLLTAKNNKSFFSQVMSDNSYYQIKDILKTKSKRFLLKIRDIGALSEYKGDVKPNRYILDRLLVTNKQKYAYSKGIKYISSRSDKAYISKTAVDNLSCEIQHPIENYTIALNFNNNALGRTPINVFIGKNATGKSFALKHISHEFISGHSSSDVINKVIVISNTIQDQYVKNQKQFKKISKGIPVDYEYYSAVSKKSFNEEDGITSPKLQTLISKVIDRSNTEKLPFDPLIILDKHIKKVLNQVDSRFTLDSGVSLSSLWDLKLFALNGSVRLDEVWFIEKINGLREIIYSSGQYYALFLMAYILSSIQNNSIILIDEIENFLHPNLIISLISSLSDLLISTNSICLIATHSLYVAREIPRSGVHIFEKDIDNSIYTFNPNIETYGEDLQKLSAYVFFSKDRESKYNEKIKNIAKRYNTKKDLIDDLHGDLSYSLLSRIADKIDENKKTK